MRALFLLAFVASSALAAPSVSFGNLTPSQVYTPGIAAQTFYVDGALGNNSNDCLNPAAGACLTVQGALNKAPKELRNQVTVSIAAGTYGGFYVSGFTCDFQFNQASSGLLIDGALVNSTLASGSATGTATGGTAGASQTFGTLIDSGAGWTVNDLVGRILTTASPANTILIESNDATTITVVGANGANWSAPTGGVTTYTIQDPSVIINTAISAPATPTAASSANRAAIIMGSNDCTFPHGLITLRNMRLTNSTGLGGIEIAGAGSYSIVQTQIRPTGVGNVRGVRSALATVFLPFGEPDLDITNTDISILGTAQALSWFSSSTVNLQNVLMRGVAAGHSQFGVIANGPINMQFCEVTLFPSGIQYTGPTAPIINANRVNCGSYTSTTALAFGSATAIPSSATSAGQVDHLGVSVCDTAIRLNGPLALDLHGLTGTAGGTGAAVLNGAFLSVNSANLNGTIAVGDGGTGQFEVNIDSSAVTGSFTDFTTGVCAGTLTYGSRACGQ